MKCEMRGYSKELIRESSANQVQAAIWLWNHADYRRNDAPNEEPDGFVGRRPGKKSGDIRTE
jgi:hypothetical protein